MGAKPHFSGRTAILNACTTCLSLIHIYLPTLALSAVPILVETPAGVISDIMGFLYETGFLAFLGIE